jgi:hypothetical protein
LEEEKKVIRVLSIYLSIYLSSTKDGEEESASAWRSDNRNPVGVTGEICTTLQVRL